MTPEKYIELNRLLSSPRVFRQTYRNDPIAFFHDCINWKEGQGLTEYQEEIISGIFEYKKYSFRGCHGIGKTFIFGGITVYFALTRDEDEDWKVATTASSWRQLQKFLWPEVHKWTRKVNWSKIGRSAFVERKELLDLSLKLKTGEGFAMASDKPESMEGLHGDTLLRILDECKAISNDSFYALEGADSTNIEGKTDSYTVAASTPGTPAGWFYDIHARKPGYKRWTVRHVTLDEAIKSGRVSPTWVEDHRLAWGETSSLYKQRVLGEFSSDDENAVIPLSWIEMSMQRWTEFMENKESVYPALTSIGVDVAAGGADKSVIAKNYSDVLIGKLHKYNLSDTMRLTGEVVSIMNSNQNIYGHVDVIGVGKGVFDRLSEMRKRIYAFDVREKSTRKDRTGIIEFANKRAESWWMIREMLDPVYGTGLMLPPDDDLLGELSAPITKSKDSSGKIYVESKEEIKGRIGRSTDLADAVIMSLYKPDVSKNVKVEDVSEFWENY